MENITKKMVLTGLMLIGIESTDMQASWLKGLWSRVTSAVYNSRFTGGYKKFGVAAGLSLPVYFQNKLVSPYLPGDQGEYEITKPEDTYHDGTKKITEPGFRVMMAPLYVIHKCVRKDFEQNNCITELHKPLAIARGTKTDFFSAIPFKDQLTREEGHDIARRLTAQDGNKEFALINKNLGLYRSNWRIPQTSRYKTIHYYPMDFSEMASVQGKAFHALLKSNNVTINEHQGAIHSDEQLLHQSGWARERALGIAPTVPVVVDKAVSYDEVETAVDYARNNLEK